MFRPTDAQSSLFQTSHFLPDDKRERLELDWPGQFRKHALPLIDEEMFRAFYCADNGRPNVSARMLAGIEILKEMFDLTDEEALYRVNYDLGWHVALDLCPDDIHVSLRTLYYFRAKLLAHDSAKTFFESITDRIIRNMGISTERQRLDSTHICSNIARLTRLGLFCETLRMFLHELKKRQPAMAEALSPALRARYIKEDGQDTRYRDAKKEQVQRRLEVCARDAYRLVERFKNDSGVTMLVSYVTLARLLAEQCEITAEPVKAEADDADALDAAVPVVVKESKDVSSASLQTPHDTDLTYSGHKGKGHETQVAETVGNGDKPEMIAYVELTLSCSSDETALVPALDGLDARGILPKEMTADTTYGSARNALECEARGVELVAPVRGPAAEPVAENEKTLADFTIPANEKQPVLCPAGHAGESEERTENKAAQDAGQTTVHATFSKIHCEACPFRQSCPAKQNADGTRTLSTKLKEQVLAKRRRTEQTERFRERYAMRAGIEGTNSELKRAHGLGRLRVRGLKRTKLAMYMKALGCNIKRCVRYLARQAKAIAKELAKAAKTALFLYYYVLRPQGTARVGSTAYSARREFSKPGKRTMCAA